MRKKAYFIVGPESAGNRMMTQALCTAKDFGEGGVNFGTYEWTPFWVQKVGNELKVEDILNSLENAPDEIVLVMSVPRKGWPNKEWIPVGKIHESMRRAGYNVYPILMSRFWKYAARSQVDRKHVPDYETAKKYVRNAYRYILDEFELHHIRYFVVEYEDFVTQPEYRKVVMNMLGINGEPQMDFFNANLKYKEGEDDQNIHTVSP
jgi:hypothetical protein